MDQVALMEVEDSLQCLPDQARDLGLGQQLVGYAVVKYLSTGSAAWTGDKKECLVKYETQTSLIQTVCVC